MNVTALSDKAWSPDFTLRKALEIVAKMEHIAILVKNKDGSTMTFTSNMQLEQLTLLAKRLDIHIYDLFCSHYDDLY